jgi:flagellar biosynthesis activator protein FlaF
MSQLSYLEQIEDSGSNARAREREALGHAVELLQRLQANELADDSAIELLLYVRRIWTIFIVDLSKPENGLPEKLRADLISIGFWIIKEADLIRDSKSGDLQSLIDINVIIRDSLT